MRIKSLRLRDYRNFREGQVAFSPRLNILLGENGQGKTNLLEALSLLTHGESFRFGDNGVLIRADSQEAVIEAKLERQDLDYEVRMQILKSRKNLSLNGKKATSPEIRRLFPNVIFSPESLSAIKEGADLRRQLVDDFLISHNPMNANLIQDYRKALKTRNRVLRDLSEALGERKSQLAVLESLNPAFFRLAALLTAARIAALKAILPEFNRAMQDISKSPTVDISVDYSVSGESALQFSLEEVNNAIQQRAIQLHDAELGSGVSLVGPHKHDIVFLYGQKDSRFYSSQGQQRAIILSFKMAQIVYHRKVHGLYPVLMLDDVLSELDLTKRQALISFLHDIKTQVFLTTTDLHLSESFSLDQSSVIRITNGQTLTEM